MNVQRRIAVLAALGQFVFPAFAAGPTNGDHTQRGLVHSISGGAETSPASAAPPEAAQPAAPQQPAAPSPPIGAPRATIQHSARSRAEIEPAHAATFTAEQARRQLNTDPSPAPAPALVMRVPSGAETARAVAAADAAATAHPGIPAARPAHVVGAHADWSGPASGALVVPAAPSAPSGPDHTRRNLVHAIGSSGTGSGSGGRLLWGPSGRGGGGGHGGSAASAGPVAVDTFNPGASWSSGLPTAGSTFGPNGSNPWSYSNFLYGGPGWAVAAPVDLFPEPFTYEPYLGADVRGLEESALAGPALGAAPFGMSAFSGGLGVAGPTLMAGGPASNGLGAGGSQPAAIRATQAQAAVAAPARPVPRVNTSYDVRPDFAVAVDAALNGDFSSSIYAMRRAAGTNPIGLIGARSSVGSQMAADTESMRRARQALAVYQSASRSVVSEADAQFMVAALDAAMGDTTSADAAVTSALAAGDASGSAALLHRELVAANAERTGLWVTGTPIQQ